MSAADDRDEIRALIHEYCFRLDAGDLDGVAQLFARARMGATTRDGWLVGVEAIRGNYDGVNLYEDGTPQTQHSITNTTITFSGPDRAQSRSYFVVYHSRADFPLQPILAGEYRDEFARADDGWHFTQRLIDPRRIGDLSSHMRGR